MHTIHKCSVQYILYMYWFNVSQKFPHAPPSHYPCKITITTTILTFFIKDSFCLFLNLHFNKNPEGFLCTLEFEKH